MIYKEEQRDLLQVPQGYTLVHCISADFALGAGVAKQIDEAYDMRAKLKSMCDCYENVGHYCMWPCCLPVENVYNLVTKQRCYHKPTLKDLRAAIEDMKKYYLDPACAHKLAMPKIGCGLDRLDWEDVKALIFEIFEDTDVEILVCYL